MIDQLIFMPLRLDKDAPWDSYWAAFHVFRKTLISDSCAINLSGEVIDIRNPSVLRIFTAAGMVRGPIIRALRAGQAGHVERIMHLSDDWLPGPERTIETLLAKADSVFSIMFESRALE